MRHRITLFTVLVFAMFIVAASTACNALDAIGPAGNCVAVPDTTYFMIDGYPTVQIGPKTHCARR